MSFRKLIILIYSLFTRYVEVLLQGMALFRNLDCVLTEILLMCLFYSALIYANFSGIVWAFLHDFFCVVLPFTYSYVIVKLSVVTAHRHAIFDLLYAHEVHAPPVFSCVLQLLSTK